MRKVFVLASVLIGASVLVSCSGATEWIQEITGSAKRLVGLDVQMAESEYIVPEGATQVTGMVISAYGNEITVQLATKAAAAGGTQDSAGAMRGEMGADEQRPGEAASGALPAGNAKVNENRMQGEVPEGMAQGNTPSTGNKFAGGTLRGESGVADGNTAPNMASQDANASMDYSDMITLGDETQLFMIPSGTVVKYYDFDMTFSQLAAEQYITITLSQAGNVLYVEVLG